MAPHHQDIRLPKMQWNRGAAVRIARGKKQLHMTEDDRRANFLTGLARHGREIGATPWEIGFADDCRTQFNFSQRQQRSIDAMRAKYEDLVRYKETGEKSLAMRAAEAETARPATAPAPSPRAQRRQARRLLCQR